MNSKKAIFYVLAIFAVLFMAWQLGESGVSLICSGLGITLGIWIADLVSSKNQNDFD